MSLNEDYRKTSTVLFYKIYEICTFSKNHIDQAVKELVTNDLKEVNFKTVNNEIDTAREFLAKLKDDIKTLEELSKK